MVESLTNVISKNRNVIVLNIILLAVYVFVGIHFHYFDNLNSSIYKGPDSKSYKSASDYIFGISSDGSQLIRRTYFYPFIIGVKNIFGDYSIYALQVIFYFLSINIIYKSVYSFTQNKFVSLLAFIAYIFNISVNLLTYEALTELTSIFISSLFVYYFSKYRFVANGKYITILLLLLSLLTVTRPNYLFHYLLFIIMMTVYFLYKKVNLLKYAEILVISLFPIVIQVALFYINSGHLGLSVIADRTFQGFYFSRVFCIREDVSLKDARSITKNWSVEKRVTYLMEDPKTALKIYFKTIVIDNMIAHSNQRTLVLYRVVYNKILLFFHVAFTLLLLVLLCGRKKLEHKLVILIPYLFSFLIIFSSGMSYAQGDRLVTPALPFWIFSYSILLSDAIYIIKNKYSKRLSFNTISIRNKLRGIRM